MFWSALAILLVAGRANAGILFSDNFDSETAGPNASLANWTVSDGTIDVLGPGYIDPLPGNGNYLDLDGSSGDAGKITSGLFTFASGVNYTLQFDYTGSQSGGFDNMRLTVGAMLNVFFATGPGGGFITSPYDFVGDGSSAAIVFDHLGGDNDGILLDNVVLSSDQVNGVPEPASAILAALGALGAVVLRRRRVA
jgi:hypothetical protein